MIYLKKRKTEKCNLTSQIENYVVFVFVNETGFVEKSISCKKSPIYVYCKVGSFLEISNKL